MSKSIQIHVTTGSSKKTETQKKRKFKKSYKTHLYLFGSRVKLKYVLIFII